MKFFEEWLQKKFVDFIISGEIENNFSVSSGWKNLRTAFLTNTKNGIIKVDFRLAFRDLTDESLVDFIDYQSLFKSDAKHLENYFIVYLGKFDNEIPDHNVNEKFLVDSGIEKVEHLYYSLIKDPVLTEIFRNNYPDDFNRLQPVIIKDKPISTNYNEKKFGLRMAGVEKRDLPGRPLISIIIPSFNSGSIIEQALQSAIVQTYDNKEIIIVDGGSTDATAAVVKKYEDKIDWFNSEPDKNIFDAINKGTYISKGMYSIFIGSDDLLMPDALENFVNDYNKSGQTDFVYGDFINLHPGGKLTFIKTFIKSKHYGKFLMGHPAMFINKKTFEEFRGFNDEYFICADADFELKLITNNKHGRKLDHNICIFRGGGHSSFKMQNVKQVYQIFKKYDALNFHYYYFAVKMHIFNIFIKIFGNKLFARLISLKK